MSKSMELSCLADAHVQGCGRLAKEIEDLLGPAIAETLAVEAWHEVDGLGIGPNARTDPRLPILVAGIFFKASAGMLASKGRQSHAASAAAAASELLKLAGA